MLFLWSPAGQDPGIFYAHAGVEVELLTTLMEWGFLARRARRIRTGLYGLCTDGSPVVCIAIPRIWEKSEIHHSWSARTGRWTNAIPFWELTWKGGFIAAAQATNQEATVFRLCCIRTFFARQIRNTHKISGFVFLSPPPNFRRIVCPTVRYFSARF